MYECECLFNDLLIVVVVYLFIRSLVMSCHSEKRKSMYRKHTATEELKSIFFLFCFGLLRLFFKESEREKKKPKTIANSGLEQHKTIVYFISFFRFFGTIFMSLQNALRKNWQEKEQR